MYLGVVFAPRIMPLWEQARLSSIYNRFQTAALAASLVLFALAVLLADKIWAILLPSSYDGSATLALLLLPSALAALVNFPWTLSFLMFTHPRFLLMLEVCALPVLIILYRALIKSQGAIGAAAITGGVAVIKTVVYQALARHTLKRCPTPRYL
jgi:O-antigen/teichoic acid export membrane protein